MKALVTGGAGFIGSNLVDALIARGDEVVVVDDLSSGRIANLEGAIDAGARFVEASVTDTALVPELFAEARPEAVFHLAAQIDVRRSVTDPAYDLGVNVGGTLNLLAAARDSGAERFVFTSTGGAIYGEGLGRELPLTEDADRRPDAPYGQSKYAAEGYCGLWSRLYGLSTASLRLGNVFGPRQDPAGDAGVIAIFCGKAIAGQKPMVFGDGKQTRDYVFVKDIVAANLLAGDHPDAHGEYNVGTSEESTVLDVIGALRAAAGLDEDAFAPRFEPARLGELQRSGLDVTRARTELGFSAQTDLRDGIAQTFAWAQTALA